MALDDYYADSNLAIARQRTIGALTNPETPPTPAFSVWGMARGLAKGLPQGTAQLGANFLQIMTGFGEVAGAYPEALGVSTNPEQQKQADQQRQKILTRGVDMDTEASDTLQEVAKSYAPDPATAHAAEQVTQGLSRFVLKAATTGTAGVAISEGMTAANELPANVDQVTRIKVGLVQGAGAAAATLPMVGPTVAKTLGLYAIGGPAGFVAQQAATRAILKNAGYTDLSKNYDPFDPLGVTLAGLIPLPFVGMGIRGIKVRERFDAETVAIIKGHTDAVDAARVALTQEVGRTASRAADGDLRGQMAHSEAMDTATQQTLAGERVQVEVPADQRARIEAEMAPRVEPELIRWAEMQRRLAEDDASMWLAQSAERDVAAASPRNRPEMDITGLGRDARALLAEGRDAKQVVSELTAAGKLTPELNNTITAVSELGRDPKQMGAFLGHYLADASTAPRGTAQMDVIAGAVEKTRRGEQVQAQPSVSPFDQHAERLRSEHADLPVEMPTGERTTLGAALDAIGAEFRQSSEDANLAMVAAQCFLELAT